MITRDTLINMIWAFVLTLFLTSSLFWISLLNANNRADRAELTIERLTEHTGRKSGGTSLLTGTNINYDLRTFDSGNTWYAVKRNDDWGISIIGEAEEVYPGLLDHLEAWDTLTEYVQKNGPIDANSIQLLEDAGFKVVEK